MSQLLWFRAKPSSSGDSGFVSGSGFASLHTTPSLDMNTNRELLLPLQDSSAPASATAARLLTVLGNNNLFNFAASILSQSYTARGLDFCPFLSPNEKLSVHVQTP